MKWYFDTSVLVAASVEGHPHHARAAPLLDAMVSRRHRGFLSAHGLAEAYSVLTRTPFVPPIQTAEAWRILEALLPAFEIVILSALENKRLVRECAAAGQRGGRVYDLIHLTCAQKANCDRIYTFNVRDFQALASDAFRGRVSAP